MKTRRDELRTNVIDIAEQIVIENGFRALTIRDIAREAGCAVGAIYNVFEDMREIEIRVNSRTVVRLGGQIYETWINGRDREPVEQLKLMAVAYLDFALNNYNAWKGIFEIEIREDLPLPEWYLEKTEELFGYIQTVIEEIYPGEPEEEWRCIVRTLYASVHGIVVLGTEHRLISIPVEALEGMITWMLDQVVENQLKTINS